MLKTEEKKIIEPCLTNTAVLTLEMIWAGDSALIM